MERRTRSVTLALGLVALLGNPPCLMAQESIAARYRAAACVSRRGGSCSPVSFQYPHR